jgi:glycosyltransferase involved in cell wall biosynthesis
LPEVVLAGELLEEKTGIPVNIMPMLTHEEMLKLHGKSRISIGLSITDAISTSLLEAMAMGSFPIQSNTSCADEWIKDGVTGLLVPPEDPEIIEIAIRKAITDNDLVDSASEINIDTIRKRADYFKLREMTISIYKEVIR